MCVVCFEKMLSLPLSRAARCVRCPHGDRCRSVWSRRRNATLQATLQAPVLDKAIALRQWFEQRSPPLTADLAPEAKPNAGGYGMFAREDIAAGTTLVSIPPKLLMTFTTALSSKLCGEVLVKSKAEEWQALVLHLLCERAAGEDSFWYPYIQMLPSQEQHPLNWSSEQLNWLTGSPTLDTLLKRRAQVLEDCELLEIAGANDLPIAQRWFELYQEPLVTESSVRWAASTLLSRGFNVDLGEEEPLAGDMSYFGSWQDHSMNMLALVPWADMLCHSSEAGQESVLRHCPDAGVLTLSAHRAYSKGEEVFDSYGPRLSPSELLLDYGFADEANTNYTYHMGWRDAVPPRGRRNAALLEALTRAYGDLSLALGPSGPDEACLTWARAAMASDAELIKAGWRIKATSKDVRMASAAMSRLAYPTSRSTEAALLASFAAALAKRRAAYPTTLEQDRELLAQPDTSWLQQQALRALTSEKIALEGASSAIRGWQEALMGGVALEDLYVQEGDSDYDGEEDWEAAEGDVFEPGPWESGSDRGRGGKE